MLGILWNLISFLVALGILITVHEFGHFLVARYYGVYVERFSIGFGKPLWQHTDSYGTEFIIALIPLGGYVKMLGEHTRSILPEEYQYAFNHKTVGLRAVIIAAGQAANLIFAVFAYWLVFVIGVPVVRPVVGTVDTNSVAAIAQIRPGMELKEIDGIETPDWETARLLLIGKIGDAQTTVIVLLFGSTQKQEKVLDLRHWSFKHDKDKKDDLITSLGIHPLSFQTETVLAKVQDHCAGQKAGLQVGDRIIKVNGKQLKEWTTFVNLVRDNLGKPLALEVERLGSPLLSLTLIPDVKPGGNKNEGFAGVIPKLIPLPNTYKTTYQYGPFRAVIKALDKTLQLIILTVKMLGKLITGNIKLDSISGPISIAQGAGISADLGVVYYLMFLALISVNLGVINLFPLPTLDGGHLLFLLIEHFKGSPISERVQDVSYRIGAILLVLLMGLAFFNDLSRL